MPRTYADFSALVSQKLQDTGVATFAAGEINYQIEECLKELAGYMPHIVEVAFEIESRYGTASSTSASNLVDATKSQFLSTDPTNEKVVLNTTDLTWAIITSCSVATTAGLSADIFTSGENYRIFNKRCRNNRQINIGDTWDYLEAIRAEYPVNSWQREWRKVKPIAHDVLELQLDFDPDDSNASLTSSRTEVLVQFNRPHVLSQLTDWAGELTANAAIGATSIAVDGLQTTGTLTVEDGEEFYLEKQRQLYMVTADATLIGGATTLSIYPGLEAAALDNDDITFVKTSLSFELEDVLADLVTARVLLNKSPKHAHIVNIGGMAVWQNYQVLGQTKLAETLARLNRLPPPKTSRSYSTE